MGRGVHDRGAGLGRRDRPAHLRRPRLAPDGPGRPGGTGIEDADRRRRRRRPREALDRPKPDPAFYQTSVADALAAHKPFILVFATPKFCTSQQCGPTLDQFKPIAAANPGVTFINVEPYQLEARRRRAPAGARRQQPAPGDGRDGPVGPALGAVDLRGRPQRRRPGLVRGHDHAGRAGRDPAGHQRGGDRRRARPAQVASSRRTATISLPSVRYQTRTGCAVRLVLDEVTRRELGPVLEVADGEHEGAADRSSGA